MAYFPSVTPSVAGVFIARACGSMRSSESIMTLPTKTMREGSIPSRSRLGSASCDGVRSRSLRRSVRTRLTSSGMAQSLLRRPASTWAMRQEIRSRSLDATSAQASVEFTSPTTTIQSGRISSSTGSKASMTLAVCLACEPDPTPR